MLRSRELATIFWMLVILLLCMVQPNIRRSLFQVLKAIMELMKTTVSMFTLAYFTMVLYLAHITGLLNFTFIKDYLIWFMFALYPMLDVLSKEYYDIKLSQMLFGFIRLSIIPLFIINEYTFSFWVELVLFPLLTLIVLIVAVAETDEKYSAIKKTFNGILSISGFIILYFALKEFYVNINDVKNLGFWGSLAFDILFVLLHLPLLFIIRLLFMYEGIIYKTNLYKPKIKKILTSIIIFKRCQFYRKKLFNAYKSLSTKRRPNTYDDLDEYLKSLNRNRDIS